MLRFVAPKLMLAALLVLAFGVPASARLSDVEATYAVDFARLSQATYSLEYTPMSSTRGGTWLRRDFGATLSGLNWMLFERVDSAGRKEWFLAYTGTQLAKSWMGLPDPFDVQADVQQALSVTGASTPQQYRDALAVAQRVKKLAAAAGASLFVGGHSLGGGDAQYVSLHTGLPAYVFNSAGLSAGSVHGGSLEATANLIQAANRNVVNVSLRLDPVSHLFQSAHWQLGTRHELELPADTDAGFLRLSAHDVGPLIRSLERDYGVVALPRPAALPSLAERDEPGAAWLRASRRTAQSASVIDAAVNELRRLKNDDGLGSRLLTPADGRSARLKDGMAKALDYALAVHDVVEALGDDLRAGHEGRFVAVRSETVEAVVNLALLLKEKPTFGVDAFTFATTRTLATKRVTIDDIEHFADAAVGLSWGLLGLVVGKGDAKVAAAYDDFGRTAAELGREATRQPIAWAFARWGAQTPRHLEDMWRTVQRRAVASGIDVRSIDQVYGRDFLLREAGFTASDLDRLAREADKLRAKAVGTATRGLVDPVRVEEAKRRFAVPGDSSLLPTIRPVGFPPPPCPPGSPRCGGGGGVAGVRIDGPIERHAATSPIARRILDSRPKNTDPLSWSVGE